MLTCSDIREEFINLYRREDFVVDKSGVPVLEICGEAFLVDEDVIFGKINEDYVRKELDWYLSKSLNIWSIEKPVPKIWQQVCDKDGFINSNYGFLIFDEQNGNQFQECINELVTNKFSRRALLMYNRPSIWKEYNLNGMSDFICTTSVQLLIRDNKLHYIVNQRSCDVIFGFNNDSQWAKYVHRLAYNMLKSNYNDLEMGNLVFQVGSLHLYAKHHHYVEKFILESAKN